MEENKVNILKFGASLFDKVTRPFRAIIVAYNVPQDCLYKKVRLFLVG